MNKELGAAIEGGKAAVEEDHEGGGGAEARGEEQDLDGERDERAQDEAEHRAEGLVELVVGERRLCVHPRCIRKTRHTATRHKAHAPVLSVKKTDMRMGGSVVKQLSPTLSRVMAA